MAIAKIRFPLPRGAGDISAGIVVFLVALPLSLGAAIAAGAPLASSLISSVIGGLIVTWISGSRVTIAAPAVGLAVFVSSQMKALGSFEAILTGVVLAGLLQVILGILRAGAVASFFPHSVIKGMLAAVGTFMILKSIPHLLGWDGDYQGNESFVTASFLGKGNTFSNIAYALIELQVGAVIVSTMTLAIYFLFQRKFFTEAKSLSYLPAALFAVIAGTLCHEALLVFAPHLALPVNEGHFVSLSSGSIASFFSDLKSPDWTSINSSATWRFALVIALFSSIESLLTVEAADRFSPKHQMSNLDRELVAQGVGNILCGLMGGLPIAAGVIRSTANIYSGARSRYAGFIQGLLVAAVMLAPGLFNHVPLAALSTIIILMAFQLIRPEFTREVYAEGIEQFLPFGVTIIAILFTDLLTGVAIGLIVGWLIVIRMNLHSAITVVSDEQDILVRFAKDVTFAHKLSLKKTLLGLPHHSRVTIDGTGAHFIDHDILDVVSDFIDVAESRHIELNLRNLRSKRLSIKGVLDGKLQEPFASK